MAPRVSFSLFFSFFFSFSSSLFTRVTHAFPLVYKGKAGHPIEGSRPMTSQDFLAHSASGKHFNFNSHSSETCDLIPFSSVYNSYCKLQC
jgi:hypothetical protein